MGKNIGKNISKYLSDKYDQKLFGHVKQSGATDGFKTASKRAIQKTAETTGHFIGNIIADKTMKVSKNAQQNNLEAVTNDHDKEIPKERYTSPEERQKIIYDQRLI